MLLLALRGGWILSALLLIMLWFWQKEPAHRVKVLRVLLGMIVTLAIVHLLAARFERPRPFNEQALLPQFGFPAGDAGVWFALVAGITLLNWRIGLPLSLLFAALNVLQIGVGLHYLEDVVAGGSLGVIVGLLIGYFEDWFFFLTKPLLLLEDRLPAIFYTLAMLILLDLSRGLSGVIRVLARLVNIEV